jgi:hypothetical protein
VRRCIGTLLRTALPEGEILCNPTHLGRSSLCSTVPLVQSQYRPPRLHRSAHVFETLSQGCNQYATNHGRNTSRQGTCPAPRSRPGRRCCGLRATTPLRDASTCRSDCRYPRLTSFDMPDDVHIGDECALDLQVGLNVCGARFGRLNRTSLSAAMSSRWPAPVASCWAVSTSYTFSRSMASTWSSSGRR